MRNIALMMIVLLVGLAGCESTGGGLMNQALGSGNSGQYQAPQASKIKIKNLSASAIQLTPGGGSVMVYWTNTSGVSQFDACQQLLESELAKKGYRIVSAVSQADYVLKCQLTYFDLLKNRPDCAQLQNLVMASTGAAVGGAIGANNHNPWAGAAIGGLFGLIVSEAINSANAQLLYYCELSVQVQERIDFIGGEPSDPIVTTDQTTVDVKTTKNGKVSRKSIEVNAENAHLQSPTETTTSVAHSGSNNSKVVSQTRAAKFQSHEAVFQTAIEFPSKNIAGSLDAVEEYIARGIAGNFGLASMP